MNLGGRPKAALVAILALLIGCGPAATTSPTATLASSAASTVTATATPQAEPSASLEPVPTVPCVPTGSEIAAWWPGEGGGDDLLGAAPAVVTDVDFVPGVVGDAFGLRGGESEVAAPPGTIDIADHVTIEAWLRLEPNPTPAQAFTGLIGKNDFPSGQPYLLLFETGPLISGGGPTLPADQWQMEYVLTLADGTRLHDQRTGVIVTVDGLFHHYAMTYDSVAARLFIDGAQRYEQPLSGALLSVQDVPVGIGGATPFAADEVALYGRALAPAEIAAIAGASSGGKCTPA